MGPEEAMIAARYIGAPLVIPIHYNTWPVIRQDPDRFRTALERTTDIRVKILSPGETITRIKPGIGAPVYRIQGHFCHIFLLHAIPVPRKESPMGALFG